MSLHFGLVLQSNINFRLFVMRNCNTQSSILRPWEPLGVSETYIHGEAKVDPAAKVGADCVIGEGVVIGEKV